MNVQGGPNPKILKWARESIHLTIEEVAKKVKKQPNDIIEWEMGENSPTLQQLEKLAYDVYKRPLAIFFFPEPPDEIQPEKSFRAILEEDLELIPSEIIKVLRKAQMYQLNLAELCNDKNPMEKMIHRDIKLSPSKDIESQAFSIRNYLSVDINEQYKWKNSEFGLKVWRESVEQRGVFIFKEPFKNNNFSGFCLYDDEFPIIVINNSIPKTRQMFTLMHELAHLLLGNNDILTSKERYFRYKDNNYDKLEILSNKIASEILIPNEIFIKSISNIEINENSINKIASDFSVSRDVILRKLFNNDIISQNYFKRLHNKWINEFLEKAKDGKKHRGDYYNNIVTYLGKNYLNLAFQKYYTQRIDNQQLAEYLSVKISSINGIEAKL
ncbi:MAG: ImmA/IrrE family metallo-endopeptidase [Spirochaetia bacterium]|nr:ImmA/IrrE family metallo-endopeptidase [Spirochaetia bacterium]